MSDDVFLSEAIRLAQAARRNGNHPFGAVLVRDGAVALGAENSVETEADPTCHAEMNLLRAAARRFGPAALPGFTLYASTEPCPMCAAAIYWAGIRRIVYGCPQHRLAALAGPSFAGGCRELFAESVSPPELVGPLLAAEAEAVHHGFWPFSATQTAATGT
ncbi:MAG TPA: nucleoside deaminase [Alphaproteobacteria bacterium]|nr:nucleoside deaminase [Alphaproteobacteria bacterium]